MRIVSLAPYLTELVLSLGLRDSLVGVSHRCILSADQADDGILPTILTSNRNSKAAAGGDARQIIAAALAPSLVDVSLLRAARPDIILTHDVAEHYGSSIAALKVLLVAELNADFKLSAYNPKTLEQISAMFEAVGNLLDAKARGMQLAQRLKAQMMDWADNFYERTKGKKVTFLIGTDPLVIGGLWLPEMIHLTSAHSQHRFSGEPHKKISWEEVRQFNPDVIVIAPLGQDVNGAVKSLEHLQKLPGWDEIFAVKRGEVVFADGQRYFNNPSPNLLESMGVLVSAIGGLESGYITERDSFHRLRWVELHRHRF